MADLSRPRTRAALAIMIADNGGFHRELPRTSEDEISRCMAWADQMRTTDELIEVERFLAGLTEQQLETLAAGEEDEATALDPNYVGGRYLNAAFNIVHEGWPHHFADPSWRCFHCGETFTDRSGAADHFGLSECELPACVQVLTEGEKAIVEDRREWRERALRAEADAEQQHHEAHMLRFDLTSSRHWKGARTLRDVEFLFEAIEGRALAAEAALNAGPRWLASTLRWLAESRWKRRRAEGSTEAAHG